MKEITARELCLADVIRLGDYAYSYATVKKIEEEEITLYRPYVHTADFSCTSGVICYLGIEEFKIPIYTNRTYILFESKDLR